MIDRRVHDPLGQVRPNHRQCTNKTFTVEQLASCIVQAYVDGSDYHVWPVVKVVEHEVLHVQKHVIAHLLLRRLIEWCN